VVKVEESLMNAITALSGSGPAYVFNFIEALVDAGVELGINRKLSTKLVIETVKGATSSLIKSGEHPVYMKEKITSPGGTTIKALNTLERYGFKAALISAVKEAAKRAEEISLKE
jgi:pyrroline-5-carboxylate reductase